MVSLCSEVTYVLRCTNDIYYVGKTSQLFTRLRSHFNGYGSVVTRTYPPLEVIRIYPGDIEKKAVLHGRSKYGVDKCFGYCYHLPKP